MKLLKLRAKMGRGLRLVSYLNLRRGESFSGHRLLYVPSTRPFWYRIGSLTNPLFPLHDLRGI